MIVDDTPRPGVPPGLGVNIYHSFIDSSHITSLKWVTGCLYNMSARRMLSEFPYNILQCYNDLSLGFLRVTKSRIIRIRFKHGSRKAMQCIRSAQTRNGEEIKQCKL